MIRMRPCIAAAVLGMFMTAAVYAEEVKKVEEKTFSVERPARVQVTADEGNIEITTWEKSEIYLKITKRAWGSTREEAETNLENIEISIREYSNKLVIRELERRDRRQRVTLSDIFDGDFWRENRWNRQQVDFELKVPTDTGLKLTSDEGDILVTGIEEAVQIQLDEGDVEITDVRSDDLQIDIDEGDVDILNAGQVQKGYWKIESDEGTIYFENGQVDEIDFTSDEGDIIVKECEFSRFWLASDEGDLIVDFTPKQRGEYHMEADEGNLEITLPEKSDIDLRLLTEEGYIKTDFKLSVRDRDDGEVLDDRIGTGGSRLKGIVDDGIIILKKRTR